MNAGEGSFLKVRDSGKLSRSARSGGPRSEAGKAVDSRNSIRTGVYSTQVVLPGESEQEFRELEQCFVEDFMPEGVTEALLVRDLAVIAWKKRRLTRMEHAVLIAQLKTQITADELFEAGLPRRDEFKWALENLEILTQENLDLYERHAELVRGMGRNERYAQKIAEIERCEPMLYERLRRMADETVLAKRQNKHEEIGFDLSFSMALKVNVGASIDDVMEGLAPYLERKITAQAEGLRYAMDHLDEINRTRQVVKDRRHLALAVVDGESRGMDYLNKSFYRTLKELRTHQEWGRRHRVIDVSAD